METRIVIENHGPDNIEIEVEDLGMSFIPANNKKRYYIPEGKSIRIREAQKPKAKD